MTSGAAGFTPVAGPQTGHYDSRFGAFPGGDGTTRFRVWAPAARSVSVECNGRVAELGAAAGGVFEGAMPARAGEDCVFVLDGAERWPDPCARCQPHGLRGPSRIVDLARLPSGPRAWRRVTLEELVIYELHVGTFSASGRFDGVIPRLHELRRLGVTAIEVMPIATFDGDRGWGYDGVYAYAPHHVYGGPEGFAVRVAAAHDAGLGVILDVVTPPRGRRRRAVSVRPLPDLPQRDDLGSDARLHPAGSP